MGLNLFPLGVTFEGPFTEPSDMSDESGIFLVAEKNGTDQWTIIFAGKSKEIQTLLLHHEKKSCWNSRSNSELGYFAHYLASEEKKQQLLERIVNRYQPVCNDA